LVVVIHCAPWPSHATPGAQAVYSDIDLLARVSVPLFVVISGLLLARHYPRIDAPLRFWQRRLKRTLLPWVLWAAIFFALTVGIGGMSADPAQSWGWWTGGAGHLFFLILIPQLYLLYLIWPKSQRGSKWALLISVAVQLTLQLARVWLPIHGGWGKILLLDYGYEEAPLWVGYFGLGVFLGLRAGRWPRLSPLRWLAAPLTLGAGLVLLAGLPGKIAVNWGPWVNGTGAFLRPSLLLLTAVVLYDIWAVAPVASKLGGAVTRRAVHSLSQNSLGIYIVHPIWLLGAGPLLEVMPRPLSLQEALPWSLLPMGVLVLSSTAFGVLGASALARNRYTAWSVGRTASG
jgi:surface polysaccharide O-acyltransferase-like enzyme